MKLLTIFMLLVAISLSCAYPGAGHMMDWGHMDYGYGGVIVWIILLVLVGIAVYFIINRKKLIKEGEEETALEILKKRYAKGELTKQEFESMKKDLE